MKEPVGELTCLLQAWQEGDENAGERVVEAVYGQLRAIAGRLMRSERSEHTLEPTALVHEAWIRLGDRRVEWANRGQFYAVAAQAMRRLLIDHARRRNAERRGGDVEHVEIESDAHGLTVGRDADSLLDLDRALDDLEGRDPRQARIAGLRIFTGATLPEIADHSGVSVSTVERDWRMARAWLQRRIG